MVLRPAAGAFRHFRISLAGDHRIHFDVLRRNYKTALAVSTVSEISVAEKPDKGRKRFLKYIFLVFPQCDARGAFFFHGKQFPMKEKNLRMTPCGDFFENRSEDFPISC